jgi:AsmA protein
MKLNADNMPVDDLETLLPALGVVLPSGSKLQGGTLTADLTISGSVNQLVIAGPVKLANTKLAGFDMGSKFSSVAALAGAKTGPDTSIQNFSTDVHYSSSGIQTSNVNLVLPALGTMQGNGTVSPQNTLDYRMTANLNGSVVGGLTKMAGVSGNSASVPFSIAGTASNPKFMPDVKGMLGNQLGNQLKKKSWLASTGWPKRSRCSGRARRLFEKSPNSSDHCSLINHAGRVHVQSDRRTG